ncbi:ABC transporter ATP-binding protein [Helcococcus kunzii]|uniref:ABC transporter ATP-binding protein n=1 Tax=Helcococcus kunzii TaxID=40091 RepID=UPI001C98929C|nr:ABC transporter ATP-binding protein [Helcococcus kunzii]MCT1796795.1 ABC transporter ATP-binding protein [Helcococcus kunzii]MCT1988353.1 ABC transporter ATP-binding protein [Helcococcus kunzii]QZO76172.1 ABC transporter ATP-binding protein [Helcococcus kunzii]
MESIVKTNNLTKRYGKKLAADKVNLTINRGDIYGLIGRNGAGKTTVLKMISDLIKPTSGEVTINTTDNNRPKIGLLIESPGLIQELDGLTNINLKLTALGINNKKYAEELMSTVGLGGEKKKIKQYSLGMKQRLGLAIALINDPEILILDEPTNGMDPQGMNDFRNLIKRLSKERDMTIIISSHILDELAKTVTRFGIIDNGSLITEISSEELAKVDKDKVKIVVENASEVVDLLINKLKITKIEQVDSNTIYILEDVDTREINKYLAENNIFVEEIFTTHQSLENYYLNLTGGMTNA